MSESRAPAEPAPEWLAPLIQAVDALPAEHPMSHLRPPVDGSGRQSAVLIALAQGESGPAVVLLERAGGLRHHPGQVAFPGGGVDPGDADLTATALREAAEEVGLQSSSVEIMTTMPQRFLPYSANVVTAVIGWWARPHPISVVDEREVASVAVVPIAELAEPANRFQTDHRPDGPHPAFLAGELFIWGFTAMMLDEVIRLGGWEQPWDQTLIRALPPTVRVTPSPDLEP